MNTRDEKLAELGRAIRNNDDNEALNILFGLVADVIKNTDRTADALERIVTAVENIEMNTRRRND